jgi:2-oxoglutarate ferredoxin oxidoreductase subunit beta
VISPCVTFNDHEGSTKSYSYVKDHDDPVSEISFVPFFDDITVEYEPGTVQTVTMPDGSTIYLRKLDHSHDAHSRVAALTLLQESSLKGEFATGLLYIDTSRPTFTDLLNTVDTPLSMLGQERTRPPKSALDEIMERLR